MCLALKDQQKLICHKTLTTNQPTNQIYLTAHSSLGCFGSAIAPGNLLLFATLVSNTPMFWFTPDYSLDHTGLLEINTATEGYIFYTE